MTSEMHTDRLVPDRPRPFEVGVFTFVDRVPDPLTGAVLGEQQRMRNLLEEVELADQVGLDVFGVGEHHRKEYVVSAPAVVLAAAAERTRHGGRAGGTRRDRPAPRGIVKSIVRLL